jgi:hypothetical protein
MSVGPAPRMDDPKTASPALRPTPPVAAQVGNDHAMSTCERIDDRLKHLAGDHQPMHKQEWRPRTALGEVRQIHEARPSVIELRWLRPSDPT